MFLSARVQKSIFDPRFAGFSGRKEREIRNWICNLGKLSQTRAICVTASPEMTCFLLFDKLCVKLYTEQNFVVGNSNSDDGTQTRQERGALKLKSRLSLIQFRSSDFLCNTIECPSRLQVTLQKDSSSFVPFTYLCFKQSLTTNG